MEEESRATCRICHKECDTTNTATTSILSDKGCAGIRAANISHKDSITVSVGQKVHKDCRNNYTNARCIKRDLRAKEVEVSLHPPSLRSSEPSFNFASHCLFCGRAAKYDDNKRGHDVHHVRTSEFDKTILDKCKSRDDEWARIVLERLGYAPDLHAANNVVSTFEWTDKSQAVNSPIKEATLVGQKILIASRYFKW